MEEIWKKIKIEFIDNVYEVSNKGRVRCDGKIIPTRYNENKREYVFLFYLNHQKMYFIDRLVAETFLDNPHNLFFIEHKDGNNKNSKVENLNFVNKSEKKYKKYLFFI